MSETRDRFKTALWADKNINILVGGAGGISSWATLFLARSNNKYCITVVDPDVVEEVNYGGQFFTKNCLGKTKVNALFRSINDVVPNPPVIYTIDRTVQNTVLSSHLNEYVIAGFDNMEARTYLFNKWKENPNRKIFIEGRLLAEFFEIYVVVPGREEEYEKTLFSQNEVNNTDAPCTFRATSHYGAAIGAKINHVLNSYLANLSQGTLLYSLPFRYAEYGPQWKTEISYLEEDLDELFANLKRQENEANEPMEDSEESSESSEENVDTGEWGIDESLS